MLLDINTKLNDLETLHSSENVPFFFRQASENKREQLRRYLEKTGVVDSLTSGTV